MKLIRKLEDLLGLAGVTKQGGNYLVHGDKIYVINERTSQEYLKQVLHKCGYDAFVDLEGEIK